MKIFKFNFFLFSLILLFGCQSEEFASGDNYFDYHVRIDTPAPIYGYSSDFINQMEKTLGLRSLKGGFDSVQIRFYIFRGSSQDEGHLIILKNNLGWKGMYYKYTYKEYIKRDTFILKDVTTERAYPKNWDTLVNILFKNNLIHLPDSHKVKNYDEEATTGIAFVIIEYADKKIYRQYTYGAPKYSDSAILEQRQITNILKAVSDELNIPVIKKTMIGN